LRTIYKNAAFGTKVFIFTLEQAYIKVKEAAASKNNYMLIARTPIIFEKLLDAGIDFGKRLVIGPMSAAPGRTIVAKGTCLTDEEIECCKRMVEKGIQIVMQLFPDNPAVDFFLSK
jgi:mannose/fructose/N-acetylgalactosamine-specific phosphotransferase system component IIB